MSSWGLENQTPFVVSTVERFRASDSGTYELLSMLGLLRDLSSGQGSFL